MALKTITLRKQLQELELSMKFATGTNAISNFKQYFNNTRLLQEGHDQSGSMGLEDMCFAYD